MSSVLADLRFSVRTLRRSPGFTTLAVVTLAVGIGGTTALFSLVDAVLLRPLPFKDPHELVEIWGRDGQRTGMRVPGPLLEALRSRARTLQAIATHDPAGGVITGESGPIDIRGEAVSASFAEVFGVRPVAGRAFVPDDERPGAAAVMLVSFEFWRRHLGGSPNAVGRIVHLDGVPYEVVGIMPRDFNTRFMNDGVSFWTPYAGHPSRQRERDLGYEVVARLATGASLSSAQREIEVIGDADEFSEWRRPGRRLGLAPLREDIVGDRADALTLLLAAAALVLAAACANLAQLLLARSHTRVREFATRHALGAARGEIFRLALMDSLLLSAAGGVLGVALAYVTVPVMLTLAPVQIPRLASAAIDVRVLVVAAAISVLTGCVFGLAPALRMSRLSVTEGLKPGSGAGSVRRRGPSILIVAQVATAVVLVVLAGLVGRTFLTLLPASPGFATEGRSTFAWSLDERRFPDAADRRRRVSEWVERLEVSLSSTSAAVASRIPFGDDESRNIPLRRSDDASAVGATTVRTDIRAVSLNYFALLEVPLLRGRSFQPSDRSGAPRVAIVNQTLARTLDPSGNPLGQSIRLGTSATAAPYEVVGVVADTRWWGTTLQPLNEVYTPLAQDRASFGYLIVRSDTTGEALTSTVRRTFHAALPGAALPAERRAVPLEELIGRSIAGPRFNAMLIGSFSAVTLLLSVVGLFGLVAYSVSQRRTELALRVALGARPVDLVVTSMRWGILSTGIGVFFGLLAAVYLTRFLEGQLHGMDRLDPATFAAAAVLMLSAGTAATYLPARRAAGADPMDTLRHQ